MNTQQNIKSPFTDLFKNLKNIGNHEGKSIYAYRPPPKRTLEEKKHKFIVKKDGVLHYASNLVELQRRLSVDRSLLIKIRDGSIYGDKYEVIRWNNQDLH